MPLIIANFAPSKDDNSPINKLRELNDKRIIILDETDSKQSTFTGFVENILPDLYEEEDNIMITETMQKLYPFKDEDENQNVITE